MRFAVALLAFSLFAIAAFAVGPVPHAVAEGPCGTSHDTMDHAEFEVLALLQQYRDANLSNSSPLTPSGPLIRAASWYAEHSVNRTLEDDKLHIDEFGRDYPERALDCGWPAIVDLHEGGIYSKAIGIVGRSMPYKDFEVPDEPGQPPLHCVGIGHATSGETTLWVMFIASHEGDCPEPQLLPPDPSLAVAEDPGDDDDSILSGGLALVLGLGLFGLVGVAIVVGLRIRAAKTRPLDGSA